MSSSAGEEAAPLTDNVLRVLTSKLFPEISGLRRLEGLIKTLKIERVELNSKMDTSVSWDKHLEVTHKTRAMVFDWQMAQIIRVRAIEEDKEIVSTRLINTKQEKIVEQLKSGTQIDEYDLWRDSDDEDDGEVDSIILAAEKEIQVLTARLDYEKFMFLKLKFTMDDFIATAGLKQYEKSLWSIGKKESDDLLDVDDISDVEARTHTWMKTVIAEYDDDEIEATSGDSVITDSSATLIASPEPIRRVASGSAESTKAFIDSLPQLARRVTSGAAAKDPFIDSPRLHTKVCQHCNQEGHLKAMCWFLHPELKEERLSKGICTVCKKSGHKSTECWQVHPDRFLECSSCGKGGHTEDVCWSLHPELKRKSPQSDKTKSRRKPTTIYI